MTNKEFFDLVEKYKKRQPVNKSKQSGTTQSRVTVDNSYTASANEFWSMVDKYQNDKISEIESVFDNDRKKSSVDIAPIRSKNDEEEEEESTLDFFKKVEVDDGWDVAKAILGTAGDAGLNIVKGVANMGEGLGDLISYGAAGVGDAIGKEEWAKGVRKRASENTINDLLQPAQDFLDKNSILGRTSKGIAQGVGQVGGILATGGLGSAAGLGAVGTTALTTGTMFATGTGSGMSEAYQGGATDQEAALYGVISGTADAVTELIFGGLGKSINAVGLSKGLSSADDLLAKKLTSKITDTLAKNVVEFGVKAGAEGAEEWLAGFTQAIGKKATYMSEKDFKDIVEDENLLEQFVVGAFTSGIAQSGDLVRSTKSGRDFISGLNTDEQSVVDKVYEDRVAKAEEGGKKLTGREKSKIYDVVQEQMKKGYIDADTVESVLGGESYTKYKTAMDNFFGSDTYKSYRSAEDAKKSLPKLQEEYDTLHAMKRGDMTGEQQDREASLLNQINAIKNAPDTSALKTQLDTEAAIINDMKAKLRGEVSSRVKDGYLAESYRELERKDQKFEADVSKYTDENAKKTVQTILDSGLGDNTNQFHDTVDFLAKVASRTGEVIDLTSNERLKGTEHDYEGMTVNGFVTDDGKITLNIDSNEGIHFTVGHEVTHVLEKSGAYKNLRQFIFDYAITREGLDNFNKRLKDTERRYKGMKNTTVESELTADLIGEYLFTDPEFVNNLSTSNRNLFQKIYDEVKYLFKIATAGSKEQRQLEKVMHQFDKAWRDNIKDKPEVNNEAGAEEQGFKYSIRKEAPPKNTKKAYKLMRLVDGKLYPLFIGNNEEVSVGTWYNADSPNLSQLKDLAPGTHLVNMETGEAITWDEYAEKYVLKKNGQPARSKPNKDDVHWANDNGFRFMHIEDKAGSKSQSRMEKQYGDTRAYYNWGVNGSSKSKSGEGSASLYALRPGWHFGEVPSMHQIGYGGDAGDTVRLDNQVWVEVEMSADVDYNAEAEANWGGDIPTHVPTDGYYKFATNPTQKKTKSGGTEADATKADWYVAGAFKVNRILSDTEADAIVNNYNSETGRNVPLDYRRNGGRVFNAETMSVEDSTKYSLSSDSEGSKLSTDQQEFFKDSKVVDENGNLQVLYHGSRSEAFSEFDLYEGVWLTSDPRYAEIYAGQWHSWRDDLAPVGEGRTDLNGLEPEVYSDPDYRVYKMYANIKNPADIGELDIPLSDAKVRELAQALGMRYTELKPLADEFMEEETYMLTRSREFIALATEKGFDGFKATEKGRQTWCAFVSEDQVKLTTNTTPTVNPDVRYSLSKDSKNVPINEITDFGLTMTYVRVPNQNTQYYGSKYGQNIEPAGEYMSMDTMQGKNKIDGYEYGTIQFKKPLVLEHINTGDTGWKKTVSDMYNGLTGKKLTEALIKDGYDAIVTYDEYGYSEIVNLNGTKLSDSASSSGVRFSLSDAVEETKDLMALHNLTAEKLLKSLKIGGLPMPSVAIAKAQDGHGEFGDITLVLPKDTIDPQTSSRNKLYSGDAWTPTYPSVDYKVSEKVLNNIAKKLYGLVPSNILHDLGRISLDADNMGDTLNRYGGNVIEAFKDNDALKYAYLMEAGADIELPMKEKNLSYSGSRENGAIIKVAEAIPADEIKKAQYGGYEGLQKLEPIVRKAVAEYVRETYGDDQFILDTFAPAEGLSFSDLDGYLNEALTYHRTGVEQTVDTRPARTLIRDMTVQYSYEEWLQNLFSGIVEKEGIRNNRDYFTPSGNRRSFEALHYEHNLENVIKAMREQGEKGIGNGFGGASIFGASTTEFSSIEEMKQASDRLQSMPYEEYQKLREGFTDRFLGIALSLPNEKNSFMATDSAAEVLTEAVAKYKTRSGIANYLKKELKGWATYSEQVVDDLIELVNDIRKMPTGYFEAKPQRAVGFDEVAVFVIPRNADIKLKQELLNRGYNIAEYDPDVEGDRQKVVNQFEEYKFSLSDVGETPKTYGIHDVFWSDFGTPQDPLAEFAPVQETAQEATPEATPVQETIPETETVEEVAPVAVAENETTAEDLFPDDRESLDAELDNLLKRKQALEDRMLEMGRTEDFSQFAEADKEYTVVTDRIKELDQEITTRDADRLDSIVSEDAPPEFATEWLESADVIPLTKKVSADIARDVRQQLGLTNKQMADVYNLIEEYSQSEFPDREKLFSVIKEKFGTYKESYADESVAEAKSYLRTYGLFVSDAIKNEIPDYANLMRRNWGRIRFSNEGTEVDVLYHELNSLFPHLFPESIISPTDQFYQIVDVANMDNEVTNEQEYEDGAIWNVVNAITHGVSEYRMTQREKASNKHSREAFNSLMQNADAYVPPVNLDQILANRRKPVGTNEDIAPVVELHDTATRKGVAEGQQAMWEEPVVKKVTRQSLHEGIIDDIKTTFADEGFDFDKVLRDAKDLSTFATVDNIPQRVMEKALGYKAGRVLSDLTVNKVAQNETESIKWLNSYLDRKSGLLAQISKQYNIKPESKESAASQMYAEGFYVDDKNNIISYGDAELAQDFPDAKTRNNIKKLAKDPRIRKIYDETLAKINESRARNAYPEIPRLDNYFLHFRAMEDTFSRLGLPFNPNDIRAKDLPTDLNGVTADLKPGQPYFASAMHRQGKRTSFDLLGGLERYLTSAKNQIYHIDDIQTLRALRNYIADTYGQANGLEGLDTLTEEEAQDRIEKVYGSHLSTFAKFLNEEANVLAGKTALIDRGLEGIIGRRGITFLDTINKQVGSNMVGFNISSSLTNFLPVVQTMAKTNKFDFVKALAQTTAHKVGSLFGKSDGFTENSPVVIRRKGADRFYRTPYQKVADAGYVLMGAVDDISTEIIARTKYNELTRKGMDSQTAHVETDKWVSRLMGDRSLGQQPQLYNSRMLGMLTKFQLEVRNQLDSQFYDTIQEAKVSSEDVQNKLLRNAKTAAKVGSTFFQLAVLQHVFGKVFESVAGYNPAFDIVDVLIKTFGWDDDEEDEDTVLDNVEEGFLALLEDLPYTSTLTGGRIPISSALPVAEFVKGKDQYGNEKSRWETLGEAAPYYLLPGGYGQIKKSVSGLSMFSDEHPVAGSYTDSGNLRFPVETTPGSVAQAGLFGQWASGNAREYFDNEWKPLEPKQTQEFIDVEMTIQEYRAYRKGLSGLKTFEEKVDYINGLDLQTWQKNILVNNLTDRKEPIDMTDYNEYDSLAEFDFAQEYPEKYEFFQANGITYQDYASSDEKGKDAYNWAYENPNKYLVSKAVTRDLLEYKRYTSKISDIGKKNDSSSGTKDKDLIKEYIFSLNLDYGQKIILYRSMYSSKADRQAYNADILDYLNSRSDISLEDEITILKELGFTVYDDGRVFWD